MENVISVLLVDGHNSVRKAYRTLLDRITGLDVVGEADNGNRALTLIRELQPHIVLLDIVLPGLDGIEVALKASNEFPNVRIVILTAHVDKRYVLYCIRAGAAGYLAKDSDVNELEIALHAVMRGEIYLSPKISNCLVNEGRNHPDGAQNGVVASFPTISSQKHKNCPVGVHEPNNQACFGVSGIIRSYGPGMEIFRQGWDGEDVFLVREGAIKLVWTGNDGATAIVGLRWPGWFLGVSSVLTRTPFPATAQTLTHSVLERWSKEAFFNCLRASNHFPQLICEALSLEVLDETIALGELTRGPLTTRLKQLLLRLGKHSPSGPQGEVRRVFPLKRADMADILHVSSRHLSRTLTKLVKQGGIRIRGEWIEIQNSGKENDRPDGLSLRVS